MAHSDAFSVVSAYSAGRNQSAVVATTAFPAPTCKQGGGISVCSGVQQAPSLHDMIDFSDRVAPILLLVWQIPELIAPQCR